MPWFDTYLFRSADQQLDPPTAATPIGDIRTRSAAGRLLDATARSSRATLPDPGQQGMVYDPER